MILPESDHPTAVGDIVSMTSGLDTADGVAMSPEVADAVERAVARPVAVDPHASRRFVVGQFGSLSDVMGPEAADEFLETHSLTRRTRVGAARRLGQISGRLVGKR